MHSFTQENSSLERRNALLAEEASDILEKVKTLEAEVNSLQERAGLPDEDVTQDLRESRAQELEPRGGLSFPVAPEDVLASAEARIPSLIETLKGEVKPALEQTLEREEALPKGIPIRGRYQFSSEFGLRQNPFGRGYEFHNGLDFKGAYGTPIYATASGVVEVATFSRGYGYHVIVDHGYGYRTLYAHLSELAVSGGMEVDRDRVVGYLGNTGRSTGPHLHYTIYRNGTAIDPKNYLD